MNKRVPFAILSCFTIAFILQGILKLSGVFIFDKSLDWDIFRIIDSTMWLSIIYYSILVFIAMYCLSFALCRQAYSKHWYHYAILVVFAFGITTLKFLTNSALSMHSAVADILYDVLLYVIVPLIIYFTTPRKDRLFGDLTLRNIVLVVVLQILLYFLYLGLNYWSGILSSIIPTTQNVVYAASMFLVQIEVYIGLVMVMLSMNMFINAFIKENNMFKPVNIASDKAKAIELEKVKAKKNAKK